MRSIASNSLRHRDECHVEPWLAPRGIVMLLHGVAESGRAWLPCIPALSRTFRVIVPDLPGCGETPAEPGIARWSMDALADRVSDLAATLRLPALHLVGSKFGGTLALAIADRNPALVRTLTILDAHVQFHAATGTEAARDAIRRAGLRQWAADSMRQRLGAAAPPAQIAWWTDYMASADRDAVLAMMAATDGLDLEPVLRRLLVPTLILSARDSPIPGREAVAALASRIAGAVVETVAGDAYHAAAAYPDAVATRIRRFIERHG